MTFSRPSEARRSSLAELPRPAVVLGFAGLIPFVICALAAWIIWFPWYFLAIELQTFYAACILSFLGAVHWGLAMAGYGAARGAEAGAMSWQRLGWSVGPALLAWIALAFVPKFGLPLLIAGFCAMFFGDLKAIDAGYAPPWYRDLRKPLTVIVILCLIATLLALLLRVPPA